MSTFSELGLLPEIIRAVEEMGYETPTPIQAQAIPLILEGRDIIGSAQTGTGKTAAFTLPMLTRMKAHKGGSPRGLILEPTRELAAQVDENLDLYIKHLDLKKALLHGGVKYGGQLDALKAEPDIVAATPGRLIDHLDQGTFDLRSIEFLVLDEVDRMLDMGFIDQVSNIVQRCPKERQTLLFSATVPERIQKLAEWALRDPVQVDVGGRRRSPAETVDHAIFPVNGIQKYDLLLAMLESFNYQSVLIFTRTKVDADRVTRWLLDHKHPVATMHSDRSQGERKEALEGFKSGKYAILVATDIAARGLDVSGITHVINYNVPQHAEDYVHRIGRTGRAAREGEAYTLFSTDETGHLDAIERYIEQKIPRRKLDGFRYRGEPDLSTGPVIRKKRNR